ncbi:MAG: transglycosylase domain-containing protein [Chloroflexi bacterium]|nr:transglycosylase domain-containing protein [Chloroflexota bacterium]
MGKILRLFAVLLMAGAAIAAGGTFAVGAAAYGEFSHLLKQGDLPVGQMPLSSKIFDRNGKLLNEVFSEARRTYVAIDQISPNLKHATIATEDADFYTNYGISPRGLLRVAWAALQDGEFTQGASTITQQLIKNTMLLSPDGTAERTPQRKLKEMLLAAVLTQRQSKDQILEWYLNQNFYGANSYGVETASQSFFGKPARDLDLAEAALLAGLPQAPASYDPYFRFDAAKERQETVLDLMVRHHFISEEQGAEAKKQKITLKPQRFALEAPHFVMYVRELMEARYGPDLLYRGGLQITTSLDLDLQRQGESIVKEAITSAAYQKRKSTNGALVSIRPTTGEVLTMVGSADFTSDAIAGQINMAVAERQPGSTLKPFTYAAAFQKGWTPATVLPDNRTGFPNGTGGVWTPGSADGIYRGNVSIRQALAMSLNTPAVLALQFIGVPTLLDTVHRMGITSLTRNDYGLALTLGGGEVKLLDLAYAYTAWPNNGALFGQQRPRSQVRPGMRDLDPVIILKVATPDGQVLEQFTEPQRRQVLPAPYAYLITAIMTDNNARTPVYGAKNSLTLPDRPVAAKTGTTDSNRDAWTMGYTPEVTGVWVGNTDYSAMTADAFGGGTAAPIWNAFMQAAHKGVEAHEFAVPPGVTQATVCASTGKLAPRSGCDDARKEWFVAATLPDRDPADLVADRRDNEATATAHAGATATAIATLTPQPTATPQATATPDQQPTAAPTQAPPATTATPEATATPEKPLPTFSPTPPPQRTPTTPPPPAPTQTQRAAASPTATPAAPTATPTLGPPPATATPSAGGATPTPTRTPDAKPNGNGPIRPQSDTTPEATASATATATVERTQP